MKILLLAGGESGEREVSLTSGAAVYKSLKKQKYDLIAIDPSTGASLISHDGSFLSRKDIDQTSAIINGTTYSTDILNRHIQDGSFKDIDLVFIALHGGIGENGSIQKLLDLAGIKYTGSGMMASATAMNKATTKKLMLSVDVATPEWKLYHVDADNGLMQIKQQITSAFKPPYIVKPNDGGSTLGLTRVTSENELANALEKSEKRSPDILVEKYIEGRELTVAVFEGKAYPVVEIRPCSGLYDYEAKYTKGKSEYIAPAELESELVENLQKSSVQVYNTLNASGLARIDFILNNEDNYFCLELNTLPGLTELSLAPMALKCEGIDFDSLINLMIKSALKQ